MDHKIRELSERFRRGLMSRRDFVEKIVALTGGAVAAKSVLTGLGLNADLIQEAKAETLADRRAGRPLSGRDPRRGGPVSQR